MNARKEKAIQEIELKAEKIALRWFEKNYDKVFRNPQLNPEQVPNNAVKLYEEIVQSRKRMIQWQKENEEKARQERQAIRPDAVPTYSDEELSRGPMYPVPAKVKELLYTGVSHNNEGRVAYLHVRNNEPPHRRFYDSQSWAMELGWDVARRAFPSMKDHCKSAIVKNSFYRRTGALSGDDLERRQPFTSAHVAVEIL